MPPAKQRATTLQEKFGFVDEELKTPQHDAMMMWIDQHAEELIREYFSVPSTWSDESVARIRSEADQIARSKFSKLQWNGLGNPPARKIKIGRKIWESPIVTSKGFAVGFADMEVPVELPKQLSSSYPEVYGREVDEADLPKWWVEMRRESVIFEAKTSIRSVGELIRQIRLYQEYKKGHYIVVSHEDKFADVLREQGIQFVKLED